MLAIVLVLVGCADDEGDRQFANDPRTPEPTATRTSEPTKPAKAPPTAPKASPEALVDRRGAPDAAWWLSDGAVWLVDDDGPRVVLDGGALAIAPGPGGNEVAVVFETDGSYRVDIYNRDGRRTDTFADVLTPSGAAASPVAPAASPVALDADSEPSVTLDWSPQGNRILLGISTGTLTDIHLDGEIARIETRVPLGRIEQAAWSPRGDVIGVLIRDADGVGSLALVDPANDPARVSVIAPVGKSDEHARSVESFDWKPRGDGIVFIEAQRGDAGPTDGMAVGWDRATNSTQILATGGQGGPSGAVTWLSVAPDGKALAYIVTMDGGGGSTFVGLFVRSLIDGQLYRVPVQADAVVLRAWWLHDGLGWISVAGGDTDAVAETRFLYIDGHGERLLLGTVVDSPGATPAASPAARPMASPVARPMASPAATPVASPVGSPAATPGTPPAG